MNTKNDRQKLIEIITELLFGASYGELEALYYFLIS